MKTRWQNWKIIGLKGDRLCDVWLQYNDIYRIYKTLSVCYIAKRCPYKDRICKLECFYAVAMKCNERLDFTLLRM